MNVLSNVPVRGGTSIRKKLGDSYLWLSRAIRDPAKELVSLIKMDMRGPPSKRIQVTEPTEKKPLN